ncbi:hypothetical protein CMT37_18535, partial [Elizabethkingia anophelis]|nr:hypothetical protein [Elizabethkingia anophelis]
IKVVQEKVPGYLNTDVSDLYIMDGSSYSFTVKTNSAWNATKVLDPDNVLTINTVSGTANEAGQSFVFTLKNELITPNILESVAQVKFSSTTGEFPDQLVTLNLRGGKLVNQSNSYMVRPSDEGIQIPVSRANADGTTRISAGQSFTTELLWTDSPNGMGANGVVKKVLAVGTGATGKVLVIPGTASGNAVVAAKVNGTIVWSWHIWSG